MGFDFFSSVLCLYGGSVAGLLGLVSTERITTHFNPCFSESPPASTHLCFRQFNFVAQIPAVAKKLDGVAAKIPEYITNVETKDDHEKLGTIEEMKVAKIKKEK
ncbi:31877_t:CDS:2, partial [Racocetra persica]